jgi:hypothetical protein
MATERKSFNAIQFIKGTYQNAPWLMMAIGIHLILLLVASIIVIAKHAASDDDAPTTVSVAAHREVPPAPPQPEEKIDRKLVPENKDAEVVSFEEETFTPSDEPIEDQDLHLDVGDPDADASLPPGATGGTSFGVGNAPGHYGTGVPSGLASRRAGGGGKGRTAGATQGTEKAVLEGLTWLARHQNPDGSWGADTLHERCDPKHPCVPAEVQVVSYLNEGLTGLALLAFLGAGYNHDSKQNFVDRAMGKRLLVGPLIKSGLQWLVQRQNEDGSFSSERAFMYNEILATMALTEAYGLSQGASKRYFKKPAEKGIQFLVEAQKKNRKEELWGWRYGSQKHLDQGKETGKIDEELYLDESYGPTSVDISVTCWAVMAFKSAEISGLAVPDDTMQGALRFAQYVTGKDGLVGYLTPDGAGRPVRGVGDQYAYHVGTMSSLGMLVRTFVTHDIDDPFLELAARQIVKDLPEVSRDRLSIDYYYWYYGSLALNQFDGPDSPRATGKYWEPWTKAMIDSVLSLQDTNQQKDTCSRGGWLYDDRWALLGGHALYNTAINVLTLEVFYRFENAFGAGMREREAEAASTRTGSPGAPSAPADPAAPGAPSAPAAPGAPGDPPQPPADGGASGGESGASIGGGAAGAARG